MIKSRGLCLHSPRPPYAAPTSSPSPLSPPFAHLSPLFPSAPRCSSHWPPVIPLLLPCRPQFPGRSTAGPTVLGAAVPPVAQIKGFLGVYASWRLSSKHCLRACRVRSEQSMLSAWHTPAGHLCLPATAPAPAVASTPVVLEPEPTFSCSSYASTKKSNY